MPLLHSVGLPVGTQAPDFSLPGTDGKTYTLDSFADAEVLVVVFTCNHCPYAKAAEDRLVALAKEMAAYGARFVAINPNDANKYPADSFENMKLRAAEKGFPFPYLFDETQAVAKAYDAQCTPDIFVFDQFRKLFCVTRLDDNWQEPSKVTRNDLRIAIESIIAQTPLPFQAVPSMGCSIKWAS
jgi:peroxiredoxin